MPNVDMSFVEKVNSHNLEIINLEVREVITGKLKEYGLLPYSNDDFTNLNLVKNILINQKPVGFPTTDHPSSPFSFLKKLFHQKRS